MTKEETIQVLRSIEDRAVDFPHMTACDWVAIASAKRHLTNSVEVKEIDLEKEIDKEWDKCEPIDEGMGLEIASIEHEQFDNIAKHFFELGLKAQKG